MGLEVSSYCLFRFSNYTLFCIPYKRGNVRHIRQIACVVCTWNHLHGTILFLHGLFTVTVKNNEYLPDFLYSFVLSGLDKMRLLSTSANVGEVVETSNERFIRQRNKQLWNQSFDCNCASGWWMYVLRANDYTTLWAKCQRSFAVFIRRYGDSTLHCLYK